MMFIMSQDILSRMLAKLRRFLTRNRDPQEPYAGVRQPLRRGPGGRGAAAALAEPD